MLKTILVCGVEFYLICEIFQRLTVTKWTCRLVYYQVSGETGIAGCSSRLDFYLEGCGHSYPLIITM